jgi:transcriptional regulator with XRE-family HTH domain
LNKKGWTAVELAEKSGVSQATLYNLQNGRAENPGRSTIEKLERVLGQPMPNDVKEEIEEGSEIQGLGELIDFDPHDQSEIPSEPGVYVLYDITERPIYVGQATVISRRIREHGDKFWFRRPIVNNAAYVRVADKTIREQVERILIKFLKKNAVINQQGVDRE